MLNITFLNQISDSEDVAIFQIIGVGSTARQLHFNEVESHNYRLRDLH